MQTKYLWIGAGAVALAGGLWFGCSARAGHDQVTLHVRNAPVAEVVKQLERQTGEKIVMDNHLNGLVTLNLKGKPLSTVLDRVAEQCGANWTTVFAVYEAPNALPALESALYGGKKLEETGWKTISPAGLTGPADGPINLAQLANLPGVTTTLMTNGTLPGGSGHGPVRMVIRRGGGTNSASLSGAEDGQLTAGGGGGMPPGTMVTEDVTASGASQSGGKGPMVRQAQGPAVVRVVRKRADGGASSVQEEIWSPTEIVLESRLDTRLGEFNGPPTAEAAAQAAKQVNGHVKTYYALRKSALGGLAGMSLNLGHSGNGSGLVMAKGPAGSGTNLAKQFVNAGPSSEELEAAMRHHRLDELGKLTPEQRVQRAREKQGLSQP